MAAVNMAGPSRYRKPVRETHVRLTQTVALFVLVQLITAVPASAQFEPAAAPLASRGGVSVSGRDLEAKLGDMDEASRLVSLQKSDRLGLLMDSTLLTLQMAEQGRQLGLDQDPLIKRQMELAAMEVLSNHVARHEMSQMSEAERLKGLESYAREQWLANRVSFDIPTVVKVSHVLVGKEGREEEEMTRLAEELLQRARDGEDFSKLVQDYSEDRSKHRNNGVIDVTEQGDLVESFKLAAFALTPEAPLSGLVETSYGLHILKLEERTEGQERSFDEVKGSLMDAMARRYDERRKQLLLSRLRADEPAHDEEAIGKYLDSLAARLRQMEPVVAEQP
jgi:hypothetical protein